MILLLAGVMMFVSCSYAGDSGNSGGTPAGNGGSNTVPAKDNIKIGSVTYEKTGEVQLMETAQIVTGSDDYNQYYTGAFPKGRTVTLSPFIMGKYEVTQELYEAVMTGKTEGGNALTEKPSICVATETSYKLLDGETQKYRPVENVTWYDAVYFCNALSEKEGLTNAYTITNITVSSGHIISADVSFDKTKNGYRLPTEAEWEYAARGGAAGVTNGTFANYWSGANTKNYSASENNDINGVAWYYYNSYNLGSGTAGYGTHQVGKKPKSNAAGLYDMSGNVWEWCYDWYATISTDAVTDPSGPSSPQFSRVRRGGGWDYNASDCAVSDRDDGDPDVRNYNLGFRVCRSAQ